MAQTGYRVRRSVRVAVALAVAYGLGAPAGIQAAPVTINAVNVWRADRTPNAIGFPPTALVPWIDVATLAGGDVSQTAVTATIGANTYPLRRIPTGVLAGLYFANIPYDPLLTGDWTITATNGADTAQATRPGFVPVDAMPFAPSISFTGTGVDITVHWDVSPAGVARLDAQNVSIWDITNPFAPVTVQFFNLPNASTRQVTLTNLVLGNTYAVEINHLDRNATTGYIDAFSGNWLNGWITTPGEVQLPAAVPEPTSLSLLFIGLVGAAVRQRLRRRFGATTTR